MAASKTAQKNEVQERRVLTFDLYGCLLNFRPVQHFMGEIAIESRLSADLAELYYNIYFSRVMYGARFLPFRTALDEILCFVDMELGTKDVFISHRQELYLLYKDLKPLPDVVPSLKALKDKGYELYLTSNSDTVLTQSVFETLGMIFDKEHTIVADEVRQYKPSIEFFKAMDDRFHLRNCSHYHVTSDYFTDVVPMVNLRRDVIYVNRKTTGLLSTAMPTLVMNNLENLDEAILRFENSEQNDSREQRKEAEAALSESVRQSAAENAKRRADYRARRRIDTLEAAAEAANRPIPGQAHFSMMRQIDESDGLAAAVAAEQQQSAAIMEMRQEEAPSLDSDGFQDFNGLGSAPAQPSLNADFGTDYAPDFAQPKTAAHRPTAAEELKELGVITPFNMRDPKDAAVAAKISKIKNMSPAKARAIAAAREKAIAMGRK